MGHEVLEARVGFRRRAEADVLAHRPEPLAVHVLVDAAGVRILAGPADIALEIDARQIFGPVGPPDGAARVRPQLFPSSPPYASPTPAQRLSPSGRRSSLRAWSHRCSTT